jgi:hypothetical protein
VAGKLGNGIATSFMNRFAAASGQRRRPRLHLRRQRPQRRRAPKRLR